MAQQVDGAAMPLDTEKVGIKGYLALRDPLIISPKRNHV